MPYRQSCTRYLRYRTGRFLVTTPSFRLRAMIRQLLRIYSAPKRQRQPKQDVFLFKHFETCQHYDKIPDLCQQKDFLFLLFTIICWDSVCLKNQIDLTRHSSQITSSHCRQTSRRIFTVKRRGLKNLHFASAQNFSTVWHHHCPKL